MVGPRTPYLPLKPKVKRNPYLSYNYRARKEGLNFHVRNRAGVRKYGSGYPELAIQEAFDSLSNSRFDREEQEKVKVDGDFHSIGATLEVEAWTIVNVIGEITLANGVDSHMLKNKATSDDHITVMGGYWDANKTNNTAGDGIHFEGTSGDKAVRMEIWDLYLSNVEDNGIFLKWVAAAFLFDVSTGNPIGGDGFHLYSFVDSRAVRIGAQASGRNLYCYGGSCSSFSDLYLGGTTSSGEEAQLYNYGLDNTQWTNIRIDNPASNGVTLANSTIQNIFSGLTITSTSDYPADNTKDALVLGTGADFNVFEGFYIGKKRQAMTKDWRYGVNEGDGEYNIYASGIVRNCQTGTKTGISGNSKWDTSTIIEV